MRVDLLDVLRPHEHQYRVLCARQRFILFIGGIGSGKTQCGAMWAVKKALEEPGSEGLIAGRRAEKDAVKLMWRRVKDVLEQLHEATGINWIQVQPHGERGRAAERLAPHHAGLRPRPRRAARP